MSDLFTPLTPPPVRRCCPDCGVELERTLPRFSLSETPSSLFADNLLLDIYTCPRCGLIRIYSYDHRQKEEEAAKAAAQPAPSPRPEAEAKAARPADPWEKGGLFRRKKDKPDWEE